MAEPERVPEESPDKSENQEERDPFRDLSQEQKEGGIAFLEKDIHETELKNIEDGLTGKQNDLLKQEGESKLEDNLIKERDSFLEQKEDEGDFSNNDDGGIKVEEAKAEDFPEDFQDAIKKSSEDSPEGGADEEILPSIEEQLDAQDFLDRLDKQEEEIEEEIRGLSERIGAAVRKAGEWYRGRPLWQKLALSGVLIGGASASALIGGAAGTAVAAAAFAGTLGQRTLGGIATFIAVEGLLARSAAKGGEDERGDWGRRRHTALAATAGILVGSGALSQAIGNIADGLGLTTEEVAQSIDAEQAPGGVMEGVAETEAVAAPADSIESGLISVEHTVVAGDNLWNVLKDELSSRGYFEHMDEAQQTHIIDAFKDKFAEIAENDPERLKEVIGISSGNIDDLTTGDELDLSAVFNDTESIFEDMKQNVRLTDVQKDAILENNAKIAQYAEAHPGETMTSAKIEEILHPAPEATPENMPQDVSATDDFVGPPEPEVTVDAEAARETALEAQRQMDWSNTMMETRINEIYGSKWYHFGSNQTVEWTGDATKGIVGIGDMPAEKVISGDFGEPFGNRFDTVESNNRKQLLEYLANLRETASPNTGETTKEYILRVLGQRYETLKQT